MLAPSDPLEPEQCWKLKQRPTMASFPPWAASGGPCYFLCWLRGSWPATNGQEAGWASPPHPPGWPSQARVAASVNGASTAACLLHRRLLQPWPRPAPLRSVQASLEGPLTPAPLTSPSCRPHVLPPSALEAVFLSPEPLWPECSTHRTEDKAGQEAEYWLLMISSGIVLEASLDLVVGCGLRFG